LKRIGLLGGSFDPPHRGHLYISMEAKKMLKLDEIWWLVTPQNPLKISKPATYKERLKNCKKISINLPIKIKEIERKINSKYTYQTLDYLINHYINIKFFWLMGADNLINFHKWQKWKQIFKEIPIVVFKRHGYNEKALKSMASKKFNTYKINSIKNDLNEFNKLPFWIWANNKEIRVSSTEIREKRKFFRSY
tara:strand:- start:53 stop:631 length:579 start_codon:yes stop_codon:yes gene_type:complete